MTTNPRANRCAVIIPAYNPTATLVELVAELQCSTDLHIVVVDDGSDSPESQVVFAELDQKEIEVLRHPFNRGKGAALKTAFTHCLKTGVAAVVTADADGQHCVADIVNVVRAARADNFQKVILGTRTFGADTPLRSKFGNTLTRWLFRLRTGVAINDTQTGLRCFPATILDDLAQLPGDRYEFESYMLLFLTREAIPLREVPIATIYIDNNTSSHFRPIVDSMRIYWLLFRDVIVGVMSFLIDIALFSTFIALGFGVLKSTYAARVCSGALNFLGCKYWVFRKNSAKSIGIEAAKYSLLAIFLALISAHSVQQITNDTSMNLTSIKILVDGALYVVSFLTRKYFIFPVQKKTPQP